MDTTMFDRLALTVAEKPDRRGLLRLFGVAALGVTGLSLLGTGEGDAKRRKKRKKRKKKTSCKGRCGGKCPRCTAGSACADRDACTTALCVNDVCTEPADAGECDLDTDGNTCFRRENKENGEHYCSRQTCRLIPGGSCDQCQGQELCSPAGGDRHRVLPTLRRAAITSYLGYCQTPVGGRIRPPESARQHTVTVWRQRLRKMGVPARGDGWSRARSR